MVGVGALPQRDIHVKERNTKRVRHNRDNENAYRAGERK